MKEESLPESLTWEEYWDFMMQSFLGCASPASLLIEDYHSGKITLEESILGLKKLVMERRKTQEVTA